jgi:hypothetical protein
LPVASICVIPIASTSASHTFASCVFVAPGVTIIISFDVPVGTPNRNKQPVMVDVVDVKSNVYVGPASKNARTPGCNATPFKIKDTLCSVKDVLVIGLLGSI